MMGRMGKMARVGLAWSVGGLLLVGLVTACGGLALTPLQSRYQREEERALRYHAQGELSRALAAYRESLRWAEIADDRPAMLIQNLSIGWVALALGQGALAESSFQRAQRLAAVLPDPEGELRARLGLAQASLQQGRFDPARRMFQQALDEARGRDVAAVLVALNGLTLAYQALGQAPAARARVDEAEPLARAHGDRRLLAATLANRAALALRLGEVEPAGRSLEEAVELDRAIENLPGLAHDLLLLAQVRQRQGDASAAVELEHQAQTILRHTGQYARIGREGRKPGSPERESSVPAQQAGLKSDQWDGPSE